MNTLSAFTNIFFDHIDLHVHRITYVLYYSNYGDIDYMKSNTYIGTVIASLSNADEIDYIDWLNSFGCRIELVESACKYGNLACLQYGLDNNHVYTPYMSEIATQKGHLICLEYLYEQGYPFGTQVCFLAAKYGHLDCLRYIHEGGYGWFAYGWGEYACQSAVMHGHLDCVKYLYDHGCSHPMSYINIHPNCVDYIKRQHSLCLIL